MAETVRRSSLLLSPGSPLTCVRAAEKNRPPEPKLRRAAMRRLFFRVFRLRLSAYDTAMYADAFMKDYIEALAVLVRPDRSDFPPDAFLGVFLRRADDKGAVSWFAAHGISLSLMGCMIAADAPAFAR
jgi:hypothetical protein